MPGGKNPDQTAVPDTTPKLQDSSLQQGDVAMLQEGQQMMKQIQKPASGGASVAPSAPAQPGIQVPDAIDFIGGRASGTLDASVVGQDQQSIDTSRWRPLMEELARDPGASGPISTMLLSQIANMNAQPSTIGVDVIDMNAANDAVGVSLGV